MAQVALLGQAKRNDKKIRTRISKTLSDHAVANTWWDPTTLPSWLTEECYAQKIQPRLRTIKVKEIAQAMGISNPYTALIRSGRRRPHPRHWQVLAKLVGISESVSN